jgi:hypothetical protein
MTEDGGAQRAAGIRDVRYREVETGEPGEREDLMARTNLDSGDYEDKDQRVILVIVKPMSQ